MPAMRPPLASTLATSLTACALLACTAEAPAAPTTATAETKTVATASAAPASAPANARASGPPRLIAAPPGGRVAAVVAAERSTAGDAQVIVYVGAGWCEPCVAFHDALLAGRLDADLPNVRFLEFDLDRDRARLAADGYRSRLVPLFAIPDPDGRASGRQLEGGIKGPGAAQNLVGRLRPLLTPGPTTAIAEPGSTTPLDPIAAP